MPSLFSIGYEDHPTPASMVAATQRAGLERLVDTRELASSRCTGFFNKALAAALAEVLAAFEAILDTPTCLLRREASPERSHRTIVADSLRAHVRGLDVVDLE